MASDNLVDPGEHPIDLVLGRADEGVAVGQGGVQGVLVQRQPLVGGERSTRS